jgi:muramoyltetrapeptide carboxypeptidase LdcA involved in peptidoglycan recycling
MGGHVTRMLTLSKTPFMPSAAGRVVFFECTARNPVDTVTNALRELRDGGFLKGAAAVVLSDFQHGGEERRRLDAFFEEFAKTLPCPVFAGFPYGHTNVSRLLDFRRVVVISPDGIVTWETPSDTGN